MSMLPLVVQAHHPTVPPSWSPRDRESSLESRLAALSRHNPLRLSQQHQHQQLPPSSPQQQQHHHHHPHQQPPQQQRQQPPHHHAHGTTESRPQRNLPRIVTGAASRPTTLPPPALPMLSAGTNPSRPFPRQTAAPTSFSGRHLSAGLPDPEHSLRRKTPSGTIDAGYDGTPVQMSHGPPALKHMLLQGSGGPAAPLPSAYHAAVAVMHNVAIDAMRPAYAPNNFIQNATIIAQGPFPGIEYYGYPLPAVPHHPSFQPAGPTPSQFGLYDGFSPTPLPLQETPFAPHGTPAIQMPAALSHNYAGPSLAPGGVPVETYPQNIGANAAAAAAMGYAAVRQVWDVTDVATPHDYVLSNNPHAIQPGPRAFAPAAVPLPLPNIHVPDYTGAAQVPPPAGFMGGAGENVIAPGFGLLPEPTGFKDRALAQAYTTYMAVAMHAASRRGLPTSPKTPVFPKAPKPNGLLWDASSVAAGVPLDAYASSVAYPFGQPMAPAPSLVSAQTSLDIITNLCEQSKWTWIDGLIVGGCLLHALGRYHEAIGWFGKVELLDPSRSDAVSNMAASLYSLDRNSEAEAHWLKAVQMRPDQLDALEHLVTVMYRRNPTQAISAINLVQQALRLSEDGRSNASCADTTSIGFGECGYAISGADTGRMVALVHAKATLLYSIKSTNRAAEAFEEAVLMMTGRSQGGIRALVQKIQAILRLDQATLYGSPEAVPQDPVRSILLLPTRAKLTASLLFAGSGDNMPGLRYISDPLKRRNAVFTTSNSLLSLAKIFQDSMSTGSNGAVGGGSFAVADILALYYLSLSLHESPSTANNVGILLAGVQQPAQARVKASLQQQLQQQQQQPSLQGAGATGAGSGIDYAQYYKYGLMLDPGHVHLLTNYGSLLKDVGMLDAAIQKYEQAVARDPKFDIALTNLANTVKDRGRIKDAISYYRRAVDVNPAFAEAVCGLSTALSSVCDWKRRGGVFLEGGRYDRWHVDDNGELQDARLTRRSSGVMQQVADIVKKQLDDAACWGSGVLQAAVMDLLTDRMLAGSGATLEEVQMQLLSWSGRRWEGSQVVRYVERVTRAKMRQWYLDRHGRRMASPAAAYLRPRLPAALTVPTAPTVLPFHTFTCPLTARDIRTISQRNALRISCTTLKSTWLPDTVYPPPRPPAPHLNVGYVSSDFNNHPLAHLMQSVFGLHNTAKVKAFCYATAPSDGSIHRQQIEREAPVFRDVSTWASHEIVDQITRDGIHILVNLNGYTRGARNEIFAARPAPVQMAFMGFAGTLGAEWCDYLLADETAVPRSTLRPSRNNMTVADLFEDGMYEEVQDGSDGWVYSENLIYCRDTFFCCDHAQSCDPRDRTSTWEDEQHQRWQMRRRIFPNLPDHFVIFGNFNQLYKIDPTSFRSWLRILTRVPNSILWLLKFPDLGEENLRKSAIEWAGAGVAMRIVFTDVAPKQEHISRARVCDLFLDTPECNAHTTAADILWSSTPLLTLPRYPYKMCSRMATSILRGALPRGDAGDEAARELTAGSDEEYEAFAVKLARELRYTMVEKGGRTNGVGTASGPSMTTTIATTMTAMTTAALVRNNDPPANAFTPANLLVPTSAADSTLYGQGSGRLVELRRLLFDNKWTCPLFDTKRWVRDLERAFDEAWRHWVEGKKGDIYL